MSSALDLLKQGRLGEANDAVKQDIRNAPANAKHRIFYFQLLCLEGNWSKALDQLNVLRDLDPATLAMANTYQEALNCEAFRSEVFAGKRAPMILGEPDDWIGVLFESNKSLVDGHKERAAELREKAFEMAPASAGKMNGNAFEWIADADSRLGPVLEAIINGKYYWLPFNRLQKVVIEEPEDLRDFVWMPAHIEFSNGGEQVALLPARYPTTESQDSEELKLGRATHWQEDGAGGFLGLGQKLLTTDDAELGLQEIRELEFEDQASEQ